MNLEIYLKYLIAMAGVTYLLRTIPFILLKGEITSRFWRSFLSYIPYTVLAAMTIPAIFYATESKLSATMALVTATLFALWGRGLILVAAAACIAVLVVDGFLGFI